MPPQPDPIPSPLKTLRTASLRFLILLVILTILWSLWYAYAAHRLNSKLAEYRAKGEPADPKDLIPPPLDPKHNAYEFALAAIDALRFTTAEGHLVDDTPWNLPLSPLSPAEVNTARALLERNAPALRLIDQMRSTPGAAWPLGRFPSSPGGPSLKEVHYLVCFCCTATRFYHQDHQDGRAIEAILDIRAFARTYDTYPATMGNFNAVLYDSFALRALRQIAPDLEIQSAAHPAGVSRQSLFQIIHDLLDQRHFNESLRVGLRGDRIWRMVGYRELYEPRPWLRPMYLLSLRRSMDSCDQALRALPPEASTFPATKALLPPAKVNLPGLSGSGFTPGSNLEALVHCLDGDDFDLLADLHYRALTDCNATAIRLAIRLYEFDHGQIPPTLDPLVNAYMPAIPPDPYRADGGPFIYAPARRLFYSVNANGIDDGAPPASGFYWLAPDAVYPLDPAPPASAQAPPATTINSTTPAPRTPSSN